jgi:hypothetical protein
MHQHLARTGLALGFLDEVDLVHGVVERGDVRLGARDLATLEDAELGGVEHLARVVDGCSWICGVAEGRKRPPGGRAKFPIC